MSTAPLRLEQLPTNLLPMLVASRPDSEYQPFPYVAYHRYQFKPELFTAPPVMAFIDLSLNAYHIVGALKQHYSATTGNPILDYFAISRDFLLQMFERDVPIYRVSDASVQYAPVGKKLKALLSDDDLRLNVYSLGGLHFRVNDRLTATEIVAVLRNPAFPLLAEGNLFVEMDSLTVQLSSINCSPSLVTVTALELPELSLCSPSSVTVTALELPELSQCSPIQIASLAMPAYWGEALEALFSAMMLDGSRIQVEGIHFDGDQLNLTYTLA